MGVLFTRQRMSAYLAREMIPCRPEFQIRKLYDKKYEYTYNIHLLGGYKFIIYNMKYSQAISMDVFDGKLIYVDPDTLDYKVYEKNTKPKEGSLPALSKFKDLHSKKDDFWILFSILEVVIAAGNASRILDYPLTVYDRACYDGNDYSLLFGLPVSNPGNTAILTSDDESKISEFCRNRYRICISENLSNKSEEDIEEWVIYLDQNKPQYKIRGRDGNVHEDTLDEWTYVEAKKIEPKVSTGLLMSISEKCEIYFDYFNARYINYVATNNADEFKKLVYIMNRYSEELGFSLVRVLAESDAMAYYRQTIKYKELFDGELDALVAEGCIVRLAENLYKLPRRLEFNCDEKSDFKILFKFCDDFVNEISLHWGAANKLEQGDIRIYKYARSINATIYEALYSGELRLHYKETGAVIDYHDLIFAEDYVLYWNEIDFILKKNGIVIPEANKFFSKLKGVKTANLESDGKKAFNYTKSFDLESHVLKMAAEILIEGIKQTEKNYRLPNSIGTQSSDGSLSAEICNLLKRDKIWGRGEKQINIPTVNSILNWEKIKSQIMLSEESEDIKEKLYNLITKRQERNARSRKSSGCLKK